MVVTNADLTTLCCMYVHALMTYQPCTPQSSVRVQMKGWMLTPVGSPEHLWALMRQNLLSHKLYNAIICSCRNPITRNICAMLHLNPQKLSARKY